VSEREAPRVEREDQETMEGDGGGRGRMNKEWKEREGRKRTRRWGWRVRDS